MKTRILRIVPISALPIGNFRSIPAEIGVTCPPLPPADAHHWVHPQEISGTAGMPVKALEPVNGSNLALEYLP
jgi:hypothetical protein